MPRAVLGCLIAVCTLVHPTLGAAAVLRVPSEYPTIQAGVDAAAEGDSVLVAPGIYTDLVTRIVGGITRTGCVFLKPGVSILSEAGAEATVIDMQQVPGPGSPHVIFGSLQELTKTVMEGFTILGQPYGNYAVLIGGGGNVTFRGCVLRDLDAGSTTAGGMVVGETDLDLIDCLFERCRGTGAGAVWHDGADLYVSGCTFQDCERTALQAWGEFPNDYKAVIEDCTFRGNSDPAGNGGGLAVRQRSGSEVRRCVFANNESRDPGGGATIGGFGAIIEDCVFRDNRSLQSLSGALHLGGGGQVRRCTFSRNSGTHFFAGSAVTFLGGPSQFWNNIVAGTSGHAALHAESGVTLTGGCNVFWQNAGGDASNYILAPTDRVVGPEFCDEAVGDLELMGSSPCLPAGSGGCDLIGALPQGCGTVSVEPRSWGKAKEAYR